MRTVAPLIVIALVGLLVYLRQRSIGRADYRCANCGRDFALSPLAATIAPHRMSAKLVRCPHCGTRSWADPAPKG